jgi:hypothetical protein
MKKYTLGQATIIIAYLLEIEESSINFIEFEDGSCRNFNFSVTGEKKRFISL